MSQEPTGYAYTMQAKALDLPSYENERTLRLYDMESECAKELAGQLKFWNFDPGKFRWHSDHAFDMLTRCYIVRATAIPWGLLP